MASAYASVAQALYVAYFGRPADVIGLSNIEAALQAADTAGTGTTAAGLYAEYSTNPGIAAIVNSFGTSKESQTLYGSNTLNFVTAVFESLFNRAPAASGLLFWTNAINTGAVTAGEAALAILAGAASADAATAAAKVSVAADFTTTMSTSGTEINAYQGATAAAAARSLLQGVTTANVATYTGASSTLVQASLNNIVVLTTPVVNETLTTGVDTFNLTGNNNHVTGTANGTGATLTAGDTIAAVAGSLGNTLTLADLSTGGTWTAGAQAGITISNIQDVSLISGEIVTVNTASSIEGFTGLQALSIQDVGGTTATAATSTAVTVIDAATGGGTDAVTGGSNVTITSAALTAGGALTVNGATGAVALTATNAANTAAVAEGNITVTGGTTVTITDNLVSDVKNVTVAAGTIAVNGSAATTSVTVTQTAAAVAAAKVAGITDGTVNVTDAGWTGGTAGTIATVSLTNANGSLIEDNGLATLTLAGVDGTVTLNNSQAGTTATTLALNVNGATATFADATTEITTLNVTTGGTAASTVVVTDAALKTLAIAGTEHVTLSGTGEAAASSITVTGGAGVTATLTANQTFTSSSTGSDVISISAATTKTVTGNGSAGEEIVWNAAAAPASTAYLGTVTGFKVLGIGSTVASTASQVFDMSKITGFSSFDVQGNATTNTIQLINATLSSSTDLSIDANFAGTVVFATSDTTGPTDSIAVTLGGATNTTAVTVAALTLEDSNHSGIGTVSLTSNAGTATNTITAFQDASLSTLNVSGTGSVDLGAFTTGATTLTINATGGSTTGALTLAGVTDSSITTLTLTGTEILNVTLHEGTTGVTVSGASDNAAITLTLNGTTAATHSDTITLGNGNDTVTDITSAGAVSITLGNGNNTVTVGNLATSNTVVVGTGVNSVVESGTGASATVTFGAHGVASTDIDNVSVTAATSTTAVTSAVVTGFNVKGADTITFLGDTTAATVIDYTFAQVNTFGNNPTTLASAVAGILQHGTGIAQHDIAEFTFGGNTYFLDVGSATLTSFAGDSLVELTGNQTFTTATGATGGVVHLAG